eukprot:jgi/Botrbrau1/4494/Bobra.0220s0027.2
MVTGQILSAVIRAARPVVRSSQDRVAFAVHSYFVANGYRTVAVGNHAVGNMEHPESLPEIGVAGWNDLPDQYAFQYVDEEGKRSPLKVHALVADNQLLISCLALNKPKEEPKNLAIDVSQFASGSDDDGGGGYKNIDELAKVLTKAFQPVEENQGDKSRGQQPSDEQVVSEPQSSRRPEPVPPVVPTPLEDVPYWERVGARDLYPPPILGGGPGPIGYLPPGGMPGRGGGMLVGPDDPLFGGHPGLRTPGSRHPPGARWDPIAPPGMQVCFPLPSSDCTVDCGLECLDELRCVAS